MQEFEHSPQSDHKQYVRKVILPSGKTIEVVSFEDLAPAGEDLPRLPRVLLAARLPDRLGRGRPRIVGGLDDRLDRGTEALVSDLRQLARANMEDAVERFSSALYAGHVLPEDF